MIVHNTLSIVRERRIYAGSWRIEGASVHVTSPYGARWAPTNGADLETVATALLGDIIDAWGPEDKHFPEVRPGDHIMIIIGDSGKSDTYWRKVLIDDGKLFAVPSSDAGDSGPARIALDRNQLTDLWDEEDRSVGNWMFTAASLPEGSS